MTTAAKGKPPALAAAAKAALNDALDQALLKLVVSGEWPDLTRYEGISSLFKLLTAHEPWRSHLTFFDVFEIVARALKRHGAVTDPKERKNLFDLLDKEHFNALRTDVRNYLLSIPRQYELWIEMPSMPRWGDGTINLTARLDLVEKTELTSKVTGKGLAALLIEQIHKSTTPVFIRVQTVGYGGPRSNATAVADGISQLKQFFQMFRRTRVYVEGGLPFAPFVETRIACFLIDPQYPSDEMHLRLPDQLGKFLATASIDDNILSVFDESAQGTLLTGKERKPENREEFGEALRREIGWIRRIMNCPSYWPDAERIRSAFEWAFDSSENDNQTLAFIQACIGLEALLGDDSQDEPLVARLADRCAYLLGQTHRDRQSIRKLFKRMYDVRSKLVHGRSARLSLSDAEQLTYAQTILGDVITEEAQRLLKALDKQDGKVAT